MNDENRQPEFTQSEREAMIAAISAMQKQAQDYPDSSIAPELPSALESALLKLKGREMPTINPERKANEEGRVVGISHLQGKRVRFHLDAASIEIFANADDVAVALGYKNKVELLGSDDALEKLLEFRRESGGGHWKIINRREEGALGRDWYKKDIAVTLSPRERCSLTDMLFRYNDIMINGFELEEKDYEEATPEMETDLWSVVGKLNPQNYDKPA